MKSDPSQSLRCGEPLCVSSLCHSREGRNPERDVSVALRRNKNTTRRVGVPASTGMTGKS
jgi:hypothetical protein